LNLKAAVVIVAAKSAGNVPRKRGDSIAQPSTEKAMTVRTRKLIGTIVLLLFLAVYALLAMFVAIVLQVNAGKWTELAYYIIAGFAWVIPAAWLVRWMQRPDVPPDRERS
jgi:Protein of unknown function (DUF2842)